jgi:outer membrane lipoprotein-sorting protein
MRIFPTVVAIHSPSRARRSRNHPFRLASIATVSLACVVRLPFLFLASVTLSTAAPEPGPLDDWLRFQGTIRSLKCDFLQTRTLPSLTVPLSTKGTFWYRHPGAARWELGQPAATIAVADGTTLTLVDIAERRARRLPVQDPRARAFTLLAADAFRDRESFHRTFSLHSSQTTSFVYQATLRPLDRRLRARIPWVIIDIDTRNNHLRAMELHLLDETRIRSIFSDIQLNPDIPDLRFHIDLAGYKIR